MENLQRHLWNIVLVLIILLLSGFGAYTYFKNRSPQILEINKKIRETDLVGVWEYASSRNVRNFFLLGEGEIDFTINPISDEHRFQSYTNNQWNDGSWNIDSTGGLGLSFDPLVEGEYGTEYYFDFVEVKGNILTLKNTDRNSMFTYTYANE